MARRKGYFITLEGPEGSGKSSQGRWLAASLRREGLHVKTLCDPGSTRLGRSLRRVLLHTPGAISPWQEALLFIGGRVRLVEEGVTPALRRGEIVVCDRFHDATVAYQGYGGGLDVPSLNALGRKAIGGVMPQMTVLLDLPLEHGFARLRRKHDRMERKRRSFHRSVRNGYRKLAAQEPRRYIVLDATRPVGAIAADIRKIVLQRLKQARVR